VKPENISIDEVVKELKSPDFAYLKLPRGPLSLFWEFKKGILSPVSITSL
jgi:hypothetical protein